VIALASSWRFLTLLLAIFLLVQPVVAPAQIGNNRIFVLDQEVLYNRSAFGQRVQQEVLSRSEAISRENQRLEEELKAEELSLTEQRPTLAQAEFRELADAFDARVEAIRTAQAGKAADLNRFTETERQRFFDAMLPVLVGLAEEIGALAVIDTRTTIISSDLINITERAIARIDAEIGDGGTPLPLPSPPTPTPPVAEQ
jgi:Skp family chaperone for outer membrane proteins